MAVNTLSRIDAHTDTPALKIALLFFTERAKSETQDDHSLAYYQLMVDYIKDILATRSTQCPTAN